MRRHIISISLGIFASSIMSTSVSASYMSNCNKLIKSWEECRASGGACQAQQKALETECKCHKQKGEEWKLIIAAVGKDGVCAPEWPDTPVPDPSPPPHHEDEKPQKRQQNK